MKLNKITIKNFRCFEQYEINFASEVNILIGKNGAGKSTVLSAIKRSLSFVFSKSSKKDDVNQLSSSNSLNTLKFNPLDARFDNNIIDYIFPIDIKTNASFNSEDIVWSMLKSKSNGKINGSLFKEAFEKFTEVRKTNDIYPILAYFSDSYPHQESSITKEVKRVLSSGKPIPRSFGYYQWYSYTSCANLWLQKFINSWYKYQDAKQSFELYIKKLISIIESSGTQDVLTSEGFLLQETQATEKDKETIKELLSNIDTTQMEIYAKKKEEYDVIANSVISEFNYVKGIIMDFCNSGHVNNDLELIDIDIERRSNKEKYMQFHFKNSRKIIFEELPAGYKRVLSIVLDLAYRSFVLNKGDRTKETGVVLIDEIDLHLHPSLQQDIIQRFKKSFPNLQFIITTHSPLVVSNFRQDEKNKTLQLNYEDEKYSNIEITGSYGIDYNTSVSHIMDTPMRNETIEYLKEAYIRLKRKGNEQRASEALQKLKEELKGSFEVIEREINIRLAE